MPVWSRRAFDYLQLRFQRLFLPREILIRADGRVAYFTLSTRLQKSAASVLVVFGAWFAYSSIGVMISERQIAEKNDEVARARTAYSELMADISSAYDQFATVAGSLEQNEAYLLGLVQKDHGERPDLATITDRLARTAGARESLTMNSQLVRERLAIFETDLKNIALEHQRLNDIIAALEHEIAVGEEQRRVLEQQKTDLARSLDAADARTAAIAAERAERDSRIAFLQSMVASLTQDRNRVEAARVNLATKVVELQNRFAALQTSQQTVAKDLAQRTKTGVDQVEKTVAMTGLDVDKLIARAGEAMPGQGGPFVDLAAIRNLTAAETALLAVSTLDSEVERWERLQYVMQILPLSAPMDHFLLSSGFGKRRDPFNGRLALHEGLDFLSETGADVMATAPGTVVFAGFDGDYGRMVEIDHGLGIHTRYAHLKAIAVKKGDLVDYRAVIGKLGSSGRSTGPHVHYEVRVDGKAVDPMKFLEAGRYVFKG
jgi:murein DD-endopeptidase MepM/ murein hydrolase activator NlpD